MAALHEMTSGRTAVGCTPAKTTQGLSPLLALHTSTDGSILGKGNGHNSGCCITAPKTQGLLPLPAHFTSTDGGIVGNAIFSEQQTAASPPRDPRPAVIAGPSHSCCRVLRRPPDRAAKTASLSSDQEVKSRLSCCRVLQRPPAKAAKPAPLIRQLTKVQAELPQGDAEAAG